MRKYVCIFALVGFILTLFTSMPVQADDSDSFLKKIRIHGFISQAYMKSTKNNFLMKSLDGSFEVNELGLTVSTNPTNRLRLGLQLLSRDLGDLGNNKMVLDWAFADYHFNEYLGLRLGKVKLPFGFYNEGRDTDLLRPMSFLPQSIYAETYRGFMVAYQGLGVYGNLALDTIGDWDYHLYYGTGNISSEETLVTFLQLSLNSLSPLTGVPVPKMQIDTKEVYGGAVTWNTFLSGLRLGFSYLHYKGEFQIQSGTPSIGQLEVKSWWVASFEYSFDNFTLAAEYSERKNTIDAFGMNLENVTSQGYYVMLSYLLAEKVTLSALYDIYYDDKTDRDGLKNVANGLPAYLNWRKDYGFCIRYDPNEHWTFKAEWHSIDGASLFLRMYNPEGFEKKWNYLIFKTSFNF